MNHCPLSSSLAVSQPTWAAWPGSLRSPTVEIPLAFGFCDFLQVGVFPTYLMRQPSLAPIQGSPEVLLS